MASASTDGTPYATFLNPPPADPAVAHPAFRSSGSAMSRPD